MGECSTIVELARLRALEQSNREAYQFLLDGELDAVSLTYAELDGQARAIAAQLQSQKCAGARAVLLYPPGLEYVAALFGCFYAGVVAIPAYPPDPNRLERTLPRLQAIVADAQAELALTTAFLQAMAEAVFEQAPDLQKLEWLATDNLPAELSAEWREPPIRSDSLALLQYTSGSTAAPRGVLLTHRNLLHNSALIHECFGLSPDSRGVIWLPPYHDMGLIGGILQPLYGGFPVTLMSPLDFLRRPLRWLQALTRYGGTTSGGPNFAYDLCVRKITPLERESLDLSRWDLAFNGAEPVRWESLERFARTFAPCGFRAEAFYPCYGLAEGTLIASGGRKGAGPVRLEVKQAALAKGRAERAAPGEADARILVGCGQALQDQQIVIVNQETLRECEAGQIGEIWIRGPSVAQGYWNQPEKTAETFDGHLADRGAGRFLRTGDLGFTQDGELFVTGRLKDLIIIRGRNHYPQDIELTVERSHPALRPGCGAAFSVSVEGEERLVVVQEVTKPAEECEPVLQAIRAAVAQEQELQVYAILLLAPGSIPKTSSGKIQRHLCRADFLSGSLEIVAESIVDTMPAPMDSSSPAEEGMRTPAPEASFIRRALSAVGEPAARRSLLTLYLQEQIAQVLHLGSAQVGARQPLTALGMDSLMSVELQHRIETDLGVICPITLFLEGGGVATLVDDLLPEIKAAEPASQVLLGPPGETHLPLSYGQRALWFLHQIAPDSTAYHIATAFRLRGVLDLAALRRALQALVDRHASLRTTFSVHEGEPRQQVHDHPEVHWEVHDASDWDEASLTRRLTEEAHRPFDLCQGPLFQLKLFERSAEEHILLLVVHHMVVDLWSLEILLHELGELYPADKVRSGARLSPLPLQYSEYVYWQKDMLARPEGERLWAYWQQQLAGELPVLALPTDRPRPPVQTFRGSALSFPLDHEIIAKLRGLAQANQATLFMALLTVFQVLLYRYTGQEDLLVGVPMAGRNRAQWADLVGYFVNTVVVRTNLGRNPGYKELLGRVREAVLGALAHQDYPFPLLVERLQPVRDTSRSPLFQVMFSMEKTHRFRERVPRFIPGQPGTRLHIGGLDLEPLPVEQQAAQFDLTLTVEEADDSVSASFQYNTDLFESETIARMAQHFQNILAAAIDDPSQSISTLPMMAEREREQLTRWNRTQQPLPLDRCLHQLFEAQVERSPQACAIVAGGESLTYRELNGRANQLARYLQTLGVRPETLVGICMERSAGLVVAVLAVLKAGGAYVPLDPAYPQERIAWMIGDARAAVLLTQRSLVERLGALPAQTICVDGLGQETDDQALSDFASGALQANLAYVLYTSGSTGKPKGVAITHHNAVVLIEWARRAFASEELASVLASTSICFDLSVFELFAPLAVGGQVVLASNLFQLPKLAAAQEVTLVNSVPSVVALYLASEDLPARVRTVNLAGEPLPAELARQLYRHAPVERVCNLYGPTEDTTYSTFAPVAREENNPPIGRPLVNRQAYVLDARLELVPIGVPGELYLGGEGLARGYLNRPDLTAERFIPNAYSAEPGARLYRTGDRARYRRDGTLEYLGRLDHQVKLRGLRVELGEIEEALARHSAIDQVVVLAQEIQPGDKRLVAYLVAKQAPGPSSSELRLYLKRELPEYMVPSAFVCLDELPRLPNGKFDRRALRLPDQNRRVLERSFVAPRTLVEEQVARIWSELLHLDRVGIHDNFFELGGHSLLASQVIARVRSAFRVELPLQNVFEVPTVAGLAQAVETALQAQSPDQLRSISSWSRDFDETEL